MVKIPEYEDPTISALKRAVFDGQFKEKKRDYLGASLIGNECARQVWYSFNHYPREPYSAETLMKFEDGHRTEDLTAHRLRQVAGLELWTHDENGNQFGFSMFDGKFKGHCDGVVRGLHQAPKSLHVWECKASGEKKWKEFKAAKQKHGEKGALKAWNNNYYVQAQLYMHFLKIDRHYLTLAYAGGRDYESCRTEYDKAIALAAIDRAEKIIAAQHGPPRLSEKPDYFVCKWCDYKEICHGER